VIPKNLENEQAVLKVKNSNVSGSSLNCCDLSGTEIQCCNASGLKMNDVNLTGMHISNANLSELDIDGAQWGGAHFRYIGYGNDSKPEEEYNDQPVQFSNCNFKQGIFTDCDLTNVKLENCEIRGLVINGVQIDKLIQQYVSSN
jgi:uncharacterized protein YjbI with pentapeptide repeats